MQEINDELMMPCAQCCRKHLSAAIAELADIGPDDSARPEPWQVLLARAVVNATERNEGYESHLPFATGLLVLAEECCPDTERQSHIREFRCRLCGGRCDQETLWYESHAPWVAPKSRFYAHIAEAEREFPDIGEAVDRKQFYRDNMSEPELRQAEVNYRLAQLKWLDENVFGYQPKEKGEEEMACGKKAACKGGAVKKAGKVKMTKLVKGNKKGK